MPPLPAPQIVSPAGGATWGSPYAIELEPGSDQIPASFDYPGSPQQNMSEVDTTRLVMNEVRSGTTVPNMSAGMMAIWRCYPRATQNGYWSGFFHCMYGTNWGGGGAGDVSAKRYVGAHPYPDNVNKWSISANSQDSMTNNLGNEAVITEWDRKYVQILFAIPSGGSLNYRFYYDYEQNPGLYIENTAGDSKADPTAAECSIIQGDAPWNPGNERYNGPHSIPDVYFGKTFTLADADIALADPFDAALSAYFFASHRHPTSNTDIDDVHGISVRARVWEIGSSATTPPLYQEPA